MTKIRFAARSFVSAVLGAVVVLSLPAQAFAQQYPPSEATLAVSSSTVVPGGELTISGDGYASGALVTTTFESTPVVLGHYTTDAAGRFTARVRIPTDATPGIHHIRTTGLGRANGQTRVLAAQVNVTPTTGATQTGQGPQAQVLPSRLSRTGFDVAAVALVGAVVMGLGVFLVTTARAGRRQRASVQAVDAAAPAPE